MYTPVDVLFLGVRRRDGTNVQHAAEHSGTEIQKATDQAEVLVISRRQQVVGVFQDEDDPDPRGDEPPVEKIKTNKDQKSPRELIQEIVLNQYLVAEYYYLDLKQPDSAKALFQNILSEYKETEYAPKAALSLGLLNENIYDNSAAADSFYKIVLTEYPNSSSFYAADRRLNDSIIEKFRHI